MALPDVPKGSERRTDNDGEYIFYNRQCKDCATDLTSRNRTSGGALRCKPCAAELARKVFADKASRSPYGTPTRPPRVKKKQSNVAERQAVHDLLRAFLAQPTLKEKKDALLAALVDFELVERFRLVPDINPTNS